MSEDKNQNNKIIFFAKTNFRNQRRKFGIKRDDRRRHMYLIGKTGMGKSTVLENMIIQDIKNGEGVTVADPHGDLAEKILDFIPSHRINDVVYFNPADIHYPIAFNVMEAVASEYKHLIASGLVGVFKKLWADSWGPRLEYVLRNAILALLDYPGSTLLGVMRILVDKNFRKKVIDKIRDPVVKAFWVDEYSKYPAQFQTEAIAPIQNKVGQFLSTALIRNIVGQVKSAIDIREIMDKKKILIMNLSKGRIGEDASSLMGAMMITKIQLAAMSRIDVPEEQRQDFYLYVDEFQNFATESFANILSEARKYRLNLIIAHQYIEQVDEIVRPAVFGNVGTIMCFRVGAGDAEFLVKEFTPYFEEDDLVNLTKYDIYMKLMIDGVSSNPFSATTLPPLEGKEDNREKIIKVSRERYATPREEVEDKIERWSGMMVKEEAKIEAEARYQRPDSQGEERQRLKEGGNEGYSQEKKERAEVKKGKGKVYVVNCYACGQPTEISFKPDGVRPVYCKKCFKEIREEVFKAEAEAVELKIKPKTEGGVEISLNEALTKPPISFKTGQPESVKEKPAFIKDVSEKENNEIAKDEISQKPPVEKKLETQNNHLKSLKPGETVKL